MINDMGEDSRVDVATWRIFFMFAKLRLTEVGVSGFFCPIWGASWTRDRFVISSMIGAKSLPIARKAEPKFVRPFSVVP
jgi:hypothetical protein